jgi:eukaryotic-like serine/threonine-protein kinase
MMPRRSDAPRDLLLGLLALYNGMVGREQLAAAIAAWTKSDRPMADLLVEQGALSPPRCAQVEDMTTEYLAAHGDDPAKSLAALDLHGLTPLSLDGAGGRGFETTTVGAYRECAPDAEESAATLAEDHAKTLEALDLQGSSQPSQADAFGPSAEATLVYNSGEPRPDGGEHAAAGGIGGALADGQRFRVLRQHARGGLGAVFVALDGELNREVALKQLLDSHADDPVSRRRFLAEAEITGALEHPGIVPVYSLGAYGDGRPFYAMRFIQGANLKEAIDQFHADAALKNDPGRRSLELHKLLRRFIDVCNTIEYAHSHQVLHRDIKPGNVIVGRHGETLVVDWGLAKQLGEVGPVYDSTEGTGVSSSASGSAETLPGTAMGTPAYMSPEQAAGELDLLEPRSDVYSLGATLYNIISGKPPFDGEVREILRKVQAGEFTPPRQIDPTIDLALEAICKKAMAQKPADRYSSCQALADDVERWMAGEPVSAYREPWTRAVTRWLFRHRTGVTGAAAAVLAGLLGLSAVAIEQGRSNAALLRANGATLAALGEAREARDTARTALVQSEKSRNEAEAVSNFMVDALKKPDPAVDGKDAKVADVLDQASAALEHGFAGSAETQGSLLDALGRSYLGLGLYSKAEESHRRAEASREHALGPANRDTLRSATRHAAALWYTGRRAESLALLEAALARQRDALGPDDLVALETRDSLGWRLAALGRTNEGIAMLRGVVAARETKLGPDHPDTLMSRNNLAAVYSLAGQNDDAIRLLEETLRQKESTLGPVHPDTLASRGNLATVYAAAGRYADAIRLHELVLQQKESKLGPEHPDTLTCRTQLASALFSAGRYADAIPLYEATLKARELKLGRGHPETLTSRVGLAGTYEALDRWADAELLRRQNLACRRAAETPDQLVLASDLVELCRDLVQQGKSSEAEPLLRECVAIREKAIPDDWRRFFAMSLLGRALLDQQNYAEAEPLVVAGYEGLKAREAKIPAVSKAHVRNAAAQLVHLYEAWGKPDLARSWAAKVGVVSMPDDRYKRP